MDGVAHLGERGNRGLVCDADATRDEASLEPTAHVLVEATQDAVTAIDDGGVDAEAGKDGRELDRDIAAALDEDGFGQFGQVEGFAGGDAVLGTRNIGEIG